MRSIAIPLLAVAFFADYLDAFGPLGLIFKAGMTAAFLLIYLPSCLRLRRNSLAAVLLAAFCVVYALCKFSNIASSSYELIKLSLTMVLVLGCINASKHPASVPASIAAFESNLRQALKIALAINGFMVLVQVLGGNHLLYLIGVPSDYFEAPAKAGRYSGIILNLPLWSAMLFARILLSDPHLFKLDAWPLTVPQKIWTYALLILSGQKYVIICVILYLGVRASRFSRLALLAILLICAPLLEYSNNSQIVDRVSQAGQIVDEGVRSLIAEADADADYPQFQFLDLRLNTWLYAWANIQVNPLGRGIGTWGDFSASLNTTITNPVTLSETQWGHLIVEQGVGGLVLIFFFSTPFLFAHRVLRSNLRWLGFFIFAAGCFTMGSSDYLWFFVTYTLLFNLRGLRRLAAVQTPSNQGSAAS